MQISELKAFTQIAKPSSDIHKPHHPASNPNRLSGNYIRDGVKEVPLQAAVNSGENEEGENPKSMGGHCERENLEPDDSVEEKAAREVLVSVKVKDN